VREPPRPARRELDTVGAGGEADRVRAAIAEADGDLERAAALLGVSRTTFWRMRKRSGD
jgi:transcriptional regulator of acetoin/glycerol metabolism